MPQPRGIYGALSPEQQSEIAGEANQEQRDAFNMLLGAAQFQRQQHQQELDNKFRDITSKAEMDLLKAQT